MNEPLEYRHICGYPLEEGSELTRCPGCGGRITPWNVKASTGEFPPVDATDRRMVHLLQWLASAYPETAAVLTHHLEADGDDEALTEARRAALAAALDVLRKAQPPAS